MQKKFYFIVGLSVFFIDQFTKWLVSLLPGAVPVFPTLRIAITSNTGAGFGLFQNQNLVLGLIAAGVIFWLTYSVYKESLPKWEVYGLALIAGGALGNLLDRVRFGAVVDFIDFSWFPTFNVADSAITIGACFLIVCWLKN